MSKQDFVDWKRHPVTQVVLSQIKTRVDDLQDILGRSAGADSRQDSVYVGAIQAYNDLLNMEYEEGAA